MARLLSAALALLLAAPAARAQGTVVVGTVVEAPEGTPIPGALVKPGERGRRPVRTNESGAFTLTVGRGVSTVHVERQGYDDQVVVWDLDEDTVFLEVVMEPAPYVLEEVRVEMDRLDRTVTATPLSVFTIGDRALQNSRASDALEAYSDLYGRRPPRLGSGPPCLLVDEAPVTAGPAALAAYHPRDLGRIYVMQGGSLIIAYTRAYLNGMRNSSWRPMSVMQQAMLCGRSRSL